MKHVWRSAFLALGVLLLGACASTPTLPTDSPSGLAIGSITYDSGRGEYSVYADNVDTGKTYEFAVGYGSVTPASIVSSRRDADLAAEGRPFLQVLPPGRYLLTGWGVRAGWGAGYGQWASRIPFTVEAGKSVYLGNFHFTGRGGSWRITTKTWLEDKAARDLPVLKKRFEVLESAPVSSTLVPGTKRELLTGERTANEVQPQLYGAASP